MSLRAWLFGAAGAAGAGAAAAGVGAAIRRRPPDHLVSGTQVPLGSLHSAPLDVYTADGVRLHVEVDEVPGAVGPPPVTLVFAHGYCLNLDCWHFQRAAYRGLVRAVYYDQRSHGRSSRSDRAHCTVEQLGDDLEQILAVAVPEGPAVLVGHSMGGMTIVALAEACPGLFGDKVIGAALISTTAGGLDPHKVIMPMLPARLTGLVTGRAISTLNRGHGAVDRLRRIGKIVANAATNRFAFGGDVPRAWLDYVDDMLATTPFEVVADFFDAFGSLDKYSFVRVLERVPTSIICGTADRLTPIGHSRKLHSRIAGSDLLECDGAGHMVIIERHAQVNAELDQLIAAALERAGRSGA